VFELTRLLLIDLSTIEEKTISRSYCARCHYPVSTCICHLIAQLPKVDYQGEIHVIQHPEEALHAKNTVNLVRLLMPCVTIWQGETPEQLAQLQQRVSASPAQWGCFYPNPKSVLQTGSTPRLPQTHLLFIDATWRKARKIWHLNPWLHRLTTLHLATALPGEYQIRKNHQPHQLSTLEAISRALSSHTDTTPLTNLFQQFQAERLALWAKYKK